MVRTAKRDGSLPPTESGYTRVEPELNGSGGERVWLFIQRRATESPITQVRFLISFCLLKSFIFFCLLNFFFYSSLLFISTA